MDKEELKTRTKEFAHHCVRISIALPENCLGNHIRCSTSVASNYRAACIDQSRASFISKLGIVIEEADEASFWIEFASDEQLLDKQKVTPILKEAEKLAAIFVSSRKTARKNIQ